MWYIQTWVKHNAFTVRYKNIINYATFSSIIKQNYLTCSILALYYIITVKLCCHGNAEWLTSWCIIYSVFYTREIIIKLTIVALWSFCTSSRPSRNCLISCCNICCTIASTSPFVRTFLLSCNCTMILRTSSCKCPKLILSDYKDKSNICIKFCTTLKMNDIQF